MEQSAASVAPSGASAVAVAPSFLCHSPSLDNMADPPPPPAVAAAAAARVGLPAKNRRS